jgi:hypothetical protein
VGNPFGFVVAQSPAQPGHFGFQRGNALRVMLAGELVPQLGELSLVVQRFPMVIRQPGVLGFPERFLHAVQLFLMVGSQPQDLFGMLELLPSQGQFRLGLSLYQNSLMVQPYPHHGFQILALCVQHLFDEAVNFLVVPLSNPCIR